MFLVLAPVFPGPMLNAAEFEVLDRFSVDGYTVLRGSADIPGGSFSVGGSTFAVKDGKVGIGITNPSYKLHIAGDIGINQPSAFKFANGQEIRDNGGGGLAITSGLSINNTVAGGGYYTINGGNVGIGTTSPAADLEVAGGIKVGTVTATCTSAIAGTLRWYDGHMSVCNGANWRQLDNQPPPTITSITPASGLYSGGTAITVIGTGFNLSLELSIGGVTATNIVSAGSTQITATTPSGTAGARELKITNSDGQYITGTFTYNPLPVISTVSPATGQTAKTTNITINGTGFLAGALVTIGGVTAAVDTVSVTQITATAPAIGTSGAKNVIVTNSDTGSVTLTNGFTYAVFAAGGAESDSGLYRVHTFNSGGTFTANFAGTVEALVVAGGGGGAGGAGGGGAGGLIYQSAHVVAAGGYSITVGNGGAGAGWPSNGTNGSNSTFDTLTAIGGGGGSHGGDGLSGGSGGGGGYGGIGGTGSQGYGGGSGIAVGEGYPGGGGGGAGGPGASASGQNAGNGGVGLQYWGNWYAGGGGGSTRTSATSGTGGLGGGGNGTTGGSGIAGTANTGGGGGAGATTGSGYNGGNGGSGIVIIRYLK